MTRLTPDILVKNWELFDKSMEDGAKAYLDARKGEKSKAAKSALDFAKGFFHGDDGLNRATNLQLALLRPHDHIQSFALLYAIMTSSSSWLSNCIAEQLIQGHFFRSVFLFLGASSKDTLQSSVFDPRALERSKRDLRNLTTDTSEAGSMTLYEKRDAVMAFMSDARRNMGAQEQLTFAHHVAMFGKSLAAKPAQILQRTIVEEVGAEMTSVSRPSQHSPA